MATWDDVRKLASALPEVTEAPHFRTNSWKVRSKAFVWVRPLNKSDIKQLTELGLEIPQGEIMGARVENELAKNVLIADDPAVFFTIPHFKNYPAILVKLDAISPQDLDEVVVEAWLNMAPPKLAEQFMRDRGVR